MFTIAFRYILKRLVVTFFVVAPIIVFMAWIAMSIKYIGLISSGGISLVTFLKLILYISPGVCGIIFPICFLLSIVIAIYGLQSNKELTVFLSSGKSPLSMLIPVLFWGGCIAGLVMFFNTMGAPHAYKNFETLKEKIHTEVSTNFLKAQSFNIIGNSVIYVGSRKHNSVENIFIFHLPKKENAIMNVITAKHSAIVHNSNQILVQLENGCRQEIDKNENVVSTLTFDSLTYDITNFFQSSYKESSKVNYKTQSELLQIAQHSPDKKMRENCLAEYHSRILSSASSIINALIVGIFLICPLERARGSKDAILAFSTGIISHVCLMVLMNLATKNNNLIIFNYAAVGLFILCLYLFFIKRRN